MSPQDAAKGSEGAASPIRPGRASVARNLPLWGAVTAVLLLAVLMRLPSCGESLWLDELHTAWTIGEGPGSLGDRAAVGNQPPLYFLLLRSGQRVTEGIFHRLLPRSTSAEVALRLPSVLAAAAAAALLCVAVTAASGQLWRGLLAGVILAIERNSLFFGTEARVYALILLATTAAVALAIACEQRPTWKRRALWVVACVVLIHLHYTAALVVAGLWIGILLAGLASRLAPAGSASPDRSGYRPAMAAVDAAWIGLGTLPLLGGMLRVWQRRSQWEAFAVPESALELLTLWPLAPLLLPPLLALAAAGVLGSFLDGWSGTNAPSPISWNRGNDPHARRRMILLALAAAVPLLAGFLLSWLGVAALWHRRYLIGVLPPLVWLAVQAWPDVQLLTGRRAAWAPAAWGGFVILGTATLLTISQGTAASLARGNWVLVERGENWRAAAAWIEQRRAAVAIGRNEGERRAEPGPVFCASLLIDRPPESPSPAEAELWSGYLTLPLAAPPYRLENLRPLAGNDLTPWTAAVAESVAEEEARREGKVETIWMAVRVGPEAAERIDPALNRQLERRLGQPLASVRRSFGSVTVWEWHRRNEVNR